MKETWQRYAWLVALLAGLLVWLAFDAPWSPLVSIENAALDYRQQVLARVKRPLPEIVIVDMDTESMDAIGEYPWSRRVHARLIRNLKRWGARVIAFDVAFLKPGLDPAGDVALRMAIEAAGNVVLGGVEQDPQIVEANRTSRSAVYAAPIFSAAHGAVGYDPDQVDGAIRHARLLGVSGVESLDLAVLRAIDPTAAQIAVNSYGSSQCRIRFAGPPGTYPTLSFARVLEDTLDPRIDPEFGRYGRPDVGSNAAFFRDKVVLVGTSAPLLHDVFHCPFALGDTMMAGVEIHANAIDTLRRLDAPADAPSWAELLIVVVAGGVALQLFRILNLAWGIAAFIGLVVLFGVANWLVFQSGWSLPLVGPIMAAGLALPATYGSRFVNSEREKARIRATFSRYVAPRIVDEMLKNSEELPTLRNERRFVTVLFTDIVGFTTFAETHAPDVVADRLNEVLSGLTQVVFDRGGTLDKYIGDAVMAVWGNIGRNEPKADAEHAVRAALDMQQELGRRREEWANSGGPADLSIRIGVHSGYALVGNFGSPLKLDYTVIGDTVNTASRLEGLNKTFGTAILVSGVTAGLVQDVIELRPLGESMLKGKSQATEVFEVVLPLYNHSATKGATPL